MRRTRALTVGYIALHTSLLLSQISLNESAVGCYSINSSGRCYISRKSVLLSPSNISGFLTDLGDSPPATDRSGK